MKPIRHLVTYSVFVVALASVSAESFRGPLPQEQRDIIHYMAEHHADLTRKVTLTPKGYQAETTTKNKELVNKLHAHVDYMKKRLDSGAMVRRWDPAYAEMVEHYEDLDAKITPIANGVKVTVVGKTPRAIKVAKNHANIVSSFVKEGSESVQRKHPDSKQLEKEKAVK